MQGKFKDAWASIEFLAINEVSFEIIMELRREDVWGELNESKKVVFRRELHRTIGGIIEKVVFKFALIVSSTGWDERIGPSLKITSIETF